VDARKDTVGENGIDGDCKVARSMLAGKAVRLVVNVTAAVAFAVAKLGGCARLVQALGVGRGQRKGSGPGN
jgi:hypothetical protein